MAALFDALGEYAELEDYLGANSFTRVEERGIRHLLKMLGGVDDASTVFSRLSEQIWRSANQSLGYIVFFRHSVLTEFPVLDPSPDEGLCLHAPRGIGFEHIAGVVRADGRAFTSRRYALLEAMSLWSE